MSRGPGRSQRLIEETLSSHGAFYLSALSHGDMTTYKSLYRAAVKLSEAERIGVITYLYFQPKVVVAFSGTEASGLARGDIEVASYKVAIKLGKPYPAWLEKHISCCRYRHGWGDQLPEYLVGVVE